MKRKDIRPPRHRCTLKEKVDFHITDISKTDTGIPVDFSFKDLKDLQESAPEFANTMRLGKADRKPNFKYFTRSLWLNHNYLSNTKNIDGLVHSIFEYPERLGFLDLSCNNIKTIHPDLLKFTNLSVLYLHGNNISTIREVFKLRKLDRLHSLTLYGNPLCEDTSLGNTRTVIKRLLPQLEKLDHNRFTKLEAEMPVSGKVAVFVESDGKKTLRPKRGVAVVKKEEMAKFTNVEKKVNCKCK